MKTISIYVLLTLFCAGTVFSQGKKHRGGRMHGEKREKIKAQKIAFITTALDLTPEEAQVFWPVYNEYNKKLDEISTEKMKLMRDTTINVTSISEKEAEVLCDKIIDFEVNEASLLKEYHVKFKKVLSKTKILKLYQAEHMFKKQLLRNMKGQYHEKGEGINNPEKE